MAATQVYPHHAILLRTYTTALDAAVEPLVYDMSFHMQASFVPPGLAECEVRGEQHT